jgi:adenylate cyclase
VNVAARLQDMTKAENCAVIISEEVYQRAGLPLDRLSRTEVSIRGRDQAMTVCTVTDPALLAGLLDEQAEHPGAQPSMSAYDLA